MVWGSTGSSCAQIAWEEVVRLNRDEGKRKMNEGGLRDLGRHIETAQGPETRADTNILCSNAPPLDRGEGAGEAVSANKNVASGALGQG